MVWILTRCCSYDWLKWTMETLLAAHTFPFLFYTIRMNSRKQRRGISVELLWSFFRMFFRLVYSFFLFFFFSLYSHTFFACRIALSCFLQCYQIPNVSSFSLIDVCVSVHCVEPYMLCVVYVYSYTVHVCMCVVWQARTLVYMYLYDIFAPLSMLISI